jgi:hypothetical protein
VPIGRDPGQLLESIAVEAGKDVGAGGASFFQGYIITLILEHLRPPIAALLCPVPLKIL